MGKDELRDEIWSKMEQHDVTLFPGARGRIPNFNGREDAAERLFEQPAYTQAQTIKINPDSPQTPVRERAFDDGKTLYMAVPKLRDTECFVELDPDDTNAAPDDIGSIEGAEQHGTPVHPSNMDPIDLIITGAVGVDEEGHRLGKGGGYSDLEFSILLTFDLIDRSVPIWTTVHDVQCLEAGRIPANSNDISLNGFATPGHTRTIASPPKRPDGLEWDQLPEHKIDAIPILQDLRPAP